MQIRKFAVAGLASGAMLFASMAAMADHQWGSYHWERDGVDPLTLTVRDAHTPSPHTDWSDMLADVVGDWNVYGGGHLAFNIITGGTGNITSYNDDYGDSGWLGIASIWATRGKNKHITRGESKVNEYYITLAGYDRFNNATAWQHVTCQEIGHTFGLDHNRDGSTGGSPDDTCMNDAVQILGYPHPNVHDDELLMVMYAHDHGSDGGGGSDKPKKCHPVFGCAGAAVGHAVWAEQYADEDEMFDAADAVVDVTVLSSGFDRIVGQAASAVPVTRVVLKVTDTLSGDTRPVIVLEQTRGPSLELHDDPGYVTGDSYTLFLREIDNNTYRIVNPDGRIRQ